MVDIEFDEEKPLSEESRVHLIEGAIKHRTQTESIPNLKGFTEYLLRSLMNDECLRCQLCKSNMGKCNGKQGGNPCLMFKKTKVVHFEIK